MSVSIGPAMTACTLTPRPAASARTDWESENAAAFEIAISSSLNSSERGRSSTS
jgi:hypothetical protein